MSDASDPVETLRRGDEMSSLRPAPSREGALARPVAELLTAVGAAVVGAAAFVLSGAWRPSEVFPSGVPPVPGFGAVLPRAVLVALVATSFLALSVGAVQRAAVRVVSAASMPVRDGVVRLPAWVLVLLLPIVIWAAILAWAAGAGRSLAGYSLAYGALLVVPSALALVWRPPVGSAGDRDEPTAASGDVHSTAPRSVRAWPVPILFGVVLAFWLPVELSLLPPLPRLQPVGVPVEKFVAIVSALWLFLVVRPLRAVGHGLVVDGEAARTALAGFLAFAAVAVPLGFAVDFLHWNPRTEVAMYVLRPILIFFTIAIPEEFLFRGIFQRSLTDRFGHRRALAVAAVIFGLAHGPNPVYIGLATLAGVAYGWVYHRTGQVAAAAITHALVDSVWVLLLRR